MSSLTIRLMSANGKGFSNAAFTMLNSPVAAAIPTARETTAMAAKPGLRRKVRSAYRRSCQKCSSHMPRRASCSGVLHAGCAVLVHQQFEMRTYFFVEIALDGTMTPQVAEKRRKKTH